LGPDELLGRAAEAAVNRIVLLLHPFERRGDHRLARQRERRPAAGLGQMIRDHLGDRLGLFLNLLRLVALEVVDQFEQALEAALRLPADGLVFLGEIGAANERLAVGGEEQRQWPAAVAADQV